MRLYAAAVLAFSLACAAAMMARADTLVILVRHAEKTTETDDPGLTAAGHARARALADALRDTRIDRVIVSEFQRTRLTAEVFIDSLGIEPLVVGANLGLDAHVQAVAQAVVADTTNVLVVGHSNTIPPIIAALGGPELPEMDEQDYSTMFILSLPAGGRPSLVKARFGAPDAGGE